MYGSDVDIIAAANNISDTRQLESGRRLLIPNVRAAQPYGNLASNDDFLWPLKGPVVLEYGQPSVSGEGPNKGINIRPERDYIVKASRNGKVVFFKNDFLNYGPTVIIDHGDGFMTVYAGAMDVSVKPGDVVTRGAMIAKAISGDIHFEIRRGAVSQNPYFYLSQQ